MTEQEGFWAAIVATATAWGAWLARRPAKRTAAQEEAGAVRVMNEVVDQLRRENKRLVERADALDKQATALRADLRHQGERLNGLVERWGRYIGELHAQIRRLGGEPAPVPELSHEDQDEGP